LHTKGLQRAELLAWQVEVVGQTAGGLECLEVIHSRQLQAEMVQLQMEAGELRKMEEEHHKVASSLGKEFVPLRLEAGDKSLVLLQEAEAFPV